MRELPVLILLWIFVLFAIYSPLLTREAKPEAKKWVNAALITFVVPQIINAIARGYKKFGKLGCRLQFHAMDLVLDVHTLRDVRSKQHARGKNRKFREGH
jgi:hypothetical protein